jgi:hypothetical protein
MLDDPVQRLDWLLGEVDQRAQNLRINSASESNAEVLLVSTSMLDSALQLTKAIFVLIANDLHLASGPTERALWELSNSFRYLLRGDARRNSLKVLINASLEVSDFWAKRPEKLDADAAARMSRSIESYSAKFPDIYAEVEAQRKRRKYHWSGLSHSAIEREIAPGSAVYQGLSWEAHAVLAPIRDVAWKLEGERASMSFGRSDDVMANAGRVAWTAGGILFQLWNEYAKWWNLEQLRVPESA